MKRPGSGAGGTVPARDDEDAFGRLPTLYSYLTDQKWEDGSERELATMTIFAQDGKWKVCINDRALKRFCITTAATFDDLMDQIEAELTEDTADWRASREGRGRK